MRAYAVLGLVSYILSPVLASQFHGDVSTITLDGFGNKSDIWVDDVPGIKEFYGSFVHEWRITGAVYIPRYNVVMCSMPKAGSTQLKMFIIRLMEFGKKKAGNYKAYSSQVNLVHQVRTSKDLKAVRSMHFKDIVKLWQDHGIKKIAFVRNPWTRSISQYHDQIIRGYVNREFKNARDFQQFNNKREGHGHHTGKAVEFCGLKYLKYDSYIDIEGDNPWADLLKATKGNIPTQTITKGWEQFTADGSPSLAHSQMQTGHNRNKKKQTVDQKRINDDNLLCNDKTAKAVFKRYSEDYNLFSKIGLYDNKPHDCSRPLSSFYLLD